MSAASASSVQNGRRTKSRRIGVKSAVKMLADLRALTIIPTKMLLFEVP